MATANATTNERGEMNNGVYLTVGTGGHGGTRGLYHGDDKYALLDKLKVIDIRSLNVEAYDLMIEVGLKNHSSVSRYNVKNRFGQSINKGFIVDVNGEKLTIFIGKSKGYLVGKQPVRNPVAYFKRGKNNVIK